MAAAASHATRHKKSKRNKDDSNTLLTALIHEGGIVKQYTWAEKLEKSRGPLYGIDKRRIAMMHAHFDAMKSEGDNGEAPDLDKLMPSASFRGTPLQNHRILEGNLEKRNQDHHWHPRRVIVTPTEMMVVEQIHPEAEGTGISPMDRDDSRLFSEILHQGYMKKRGHVNIEYKTRFFVLAGNGIASYYESQADFDAKKEPKGSFSCAGLEVVPDAGSTTDGYQFTLYADQNNADHKPFECACSSEDERSEWVAAFHDAQEIYGACETLADLTPEASFRLKQKAKARRISKRYDLIKDSIPLPAIHKIRICRGNSQEDMLDLVANRQMPTPSIDDLQAITIKPEDAEVESSQDRNQLSNAGQTTLGRRHSEQISVDFDLDQGSGEFYVMEVHTCVEGFWSVLFFRSQDLDLLCDYATNIDKYSRACMHIHKIRTTPAFDRYQEALRIWYASDPVQIVVAILIVANFLANAAQTEMLPDVGSKADNVFSAMDLAFTYIFIVELAINLSANWFWKFVTDGWCIFDFIVVGVGIVGLIAGDIPGMSTLRLMRAFRVMRLFGRLESLRQIIEALTSSLIPVGNALLIMLLVTSIYAILAVNFFAERSPEFFGNFSKALFSLFQVCTGDGWASTIARPIFSGADDPDGERLDIGTACFFVSFVVIVAWTLLQVVVAVLLDNFTQAADQEKQRKAAAKAKDEGRTPIVYAIDPLLSALAHFDTSEDLSKRINLLFRVLDDNDSDGLSFKELQSGLQKFRVSPPINISRDDWDTMTLNGKYLNSDDEVDSERFEMVMRHQLKLYVQRQMANSMEQVGMDGPGQIGTILFVLKLLMIGVDDINAQVEFLSRARSVSPMTVGPRSLSSGDQDGSKPAKFLDEVGSYARGGNDGGASSDQRLRKLEATVQNIQDRLNSFETATNEVVSSMQGDVKQILHALTTYNHRSIVSSRSAAEENREGKLPSENTYMDLSNDVMMTPVAAGVESRGVHLPSDAKPAPGIISATPRTPPSSNLARGSGFPRSGRPVSSDNNESAPSLERGSAANNSLPAGWVQMWSKTKNRPYYKNESTGKSSWILPTGIGPASTPATSTETVPLSMDV